MIELMDKVIEKKWYKQLNMMMMILLVLMMPIMKHIYIGEARINFALSDLLLPIVGILLLLNIKSFFYEKKYLFIVYFFFLILSLIVSQYMSQFNEGIQQASNITTMIEIVKTIVVGVYFFSGCILIKDAHDYKKVLLTVSLSAIFVLLIGFMAFFYAHNQVPFFIEEYQLRQYSVRFAGTLKDPNLCSLYLTVVVFISLLNIKLTKRKAVKALLGTIVMASLIGIVLTGSRGGLITLLCGSLLFVLMNVKTILRFKKTSVFLLGSIILMLVIIYCFDLFYHSGEYLKYSMGRFSGTIENGIFSDIRFTLSTIALKMGNDHSIFGIGKGAYELNTYLYVDEAIANRIKGLIPHNTILSFYAQQGIVGVMIFLSMPVFMIYKVLKSKRFTNVYFLSLLACIFVSSLALNLENIRFLWFVFALIFVAENIDFREGEEDV